MTVVLIQQNFNVRNTNRIQIFIITAQYQNVLISESISFSCFQRLPVVKHLIFGLTSIYELKVVVAAIKFQREIWFTIKSWIFSQHFNYIKCQVTSAETGT